MSKVFKSGFLVGFGVCLILFGLSPLLFMMLGVELHPSHPGSKTLLGFLDWMKVNPLLYATVKTFFSFGTHVYQYIMGSLEAKIVIGIILLAGGLMTAYGIETLRKE